MEAYQLYLICLLGSIALVAIIIILATNLRLDVKHANGKGIFILFYCLGFLLYLYGILMETKDLTSLPRILFVIASTFSKSLKIFAFSLDNGAVATALTQTWYLVTYISLHILCFSLSQIVILRIFGKSLLNYFRFLTFRFSERLLVCGDPDKVFILLNDLRKTKNKQKVLVYCCSNWTEAERKRLYDYPVIIHQCHRVDESVLGRSKIHPAGRHFVRLIALYADEQTTLDLAATIRSYLDQKQEPNILFKAYLNFERMELNDLLDVNTEITRKDGRIAFFSRSDLLAKEFINKYTVFDLLSTCNLDSSQALVDSENIDLRYFFLGFGETGRELLKKTFANNALIDCRYRAFIFDMKAKKLEAEFYQNCPGFLEELGKKYADFHFSDNIDVLSEDYYTIIKENHAHDNCFFISLGNDLVNFRTAMHLKRVIENIALDLKTEICARIFVSIKEPGKYYQSLNANSGELVRISLIGNLQEIYVFDRIVAQREDLWGRRIDRAYRILKERNFDISKENDDLTWNSKSSHYKKESSRMAGINIRSKLQLLGLDLIPKSEYLQHPEYEALVGELFGEDYGLKEMVFQRDIPQPSAPKYYDLSGNNADYERLKAIYRDYSHPATNIARQEHWRWNCFSLISGWRPLPYEQDEPYALNVDYSIVNQNARLKRHMNLVDWEELVAFVPYVSAKISKQLNINEEELKAKIYYNNDICKYDYFTIFGLTAIIEGTDYLICRKKEQK